MKYLGNPQSGSQAHTTASHNRAGQYLRSRRTPVSPTRTAKQGILRGKFGSASAAWQSLSTALQNAWTAFAHSYPVVDALGQSIVLTGQQYFIGLQTSLMNAGQAMITDVPINTSTPAVDTPYAYAGTNGLVLVGVLSVTPGDWNIVGLSKILSNGVNFNKAFSQFAVLDSNLLATDVSYDYAGQYGAPLAGRKIFARFKEVNSNGMSGPDLIIQSPVATETNTDNFTLDTSIHNTVKATCVGGNSTGVQLFDAGTGQLMSYQPLVTGIATFIGQPTGANVYVRGFVAEPTPTNIAAATVNASVDSPAATITG